MPANYPVRVDIYKLLVSLSEAMDLVSRPLVNHHKQVSYIAYSLGETIGLDEDSLRELAIAGALHDIGGLSLASRLETLDFEMDYPARHSILGAVLLAMFKPFERIAELVRYHHVYWQNGAGEEHHGAPVPRLAHILHLADRIAVLINQEGEILTQTAAVVRQIKKNTGRMFMPELVEAFQDLSVKESFWFDIASPAACRLFDEHFFFGATDLSEQGLEDLARLFCQVIDFRSRFTATHSTGVAAVATTLATKAGMDAADCNRMRLAGLLHDIGKLVVPQEILEKTKPLTRADIIFIKRHPYFSRRILGSTAGFETVSAWAALHHERLDGSGYPFHVQETDLPAGAKILAVGDTFTALTEVRPYRTSLSSRGTLQILESMAAHKKLDPQIVSLASDHIDELNAVRETAQSTAFDQHKRFMASLSDRPLHPVS